MRPKAGRMVSRTFFSAAATKFARSVADTFSAQGRDAFGQGGDERVLRRLHRHEPIELLDHALQDEARRNDARGRSGLRLGDAFVETGATRLRRAR